jgi:enterobactin synthetase component D
MSHQIDDLDNQFGRFFQAVGSLKLPQAPWLDILHCRFDIAAYSDALFSHYGITFPIALSNSINKRRAEYFAGRFLCRQLLLARGLPIQVASGHHRQPLWPEGWMGSITHSGDTALVAVAEDRSEHVLGLDLENWLSPLQAAEIRNQVTVSGELERLNSDWAPERLMTLVFSAKESLFKALYPKVKEYFDFNCAELLRLDQFSGRFTLGLRHTLARGLTAGQRFEGGWLLLAGQLLTVIFAVEDGGSFPLSEARSRSPE